MSWVDSAREIETVYGGYVDWEERFFICPECAEPVYEYDWECFEDCPICGFEFFESEIWEDDEE